MKKDVLVKIKNNPPFILVIIITLLVGWALLKPGYFSMHDDVQVMRLYEMERCLKDGQIPCRWVPDFGAGYGHPLYNYHPVFPYYLGMFFRLFGMSFIDIVKILFFLTFLLSGIFMYFLVKEFFGKWAGMVASAFYLLAPYHAVDIYVRGALTESWAVAFFPLILWGIYKLIKTSKFPFFLVSLFALTFLFLSHNVMSLVFVPIAFIWGFYWIWQTKEWKKIVPLVIVFFWAVGLAAFFVLPAFFEQPFVTLEQHTTGYYNFHQHFATVKQLFISRHWGFGPSKPGPDDDLSFQIGWPHWWLVIIAGGIFVYLFLRKKRKFLWTFAFFLALFGLTVFMTHAKSVFIWKALPLLSFVQFPWRFLAIVMLASSFLAGGLVGFLKKGRKQLILSLVLILLVLVLNLGYFHPEKYDFQMTDEKKLSGEGWQIQSMTTLNDYVPKSVKEMPKELAPGEPRVIEGEARVSEFKKRSNFWRFTIETIGEQPPTIEVPVFDFPQWEVFADLDKVDYQVNPDSGVIQVQVPLNKRTVTAWLRNTPLRKAANGISLFSFSLLILVVAWQEKREEKII